MGTYRTPNIGGSRVEPGVIQPPKSVHQGRLCSAIRTAHVPPEAGVGGFDGGYKAPPSKMRAAAVRSQPAPAATRSVANSPAAMLGLPPQSVSRARNRGC